MQPDDFKQLAINIVRDHARKYTLVELLELYNQLSERIVIHEGELTPDMEAEFNSLTLETEHKVDTYAFVLERLKFETAFWKKKIEGIEKIKKGLENAEERLKKRVKEIMLSKGLSKLEGLEDGFTLSKTKDRILVDESKLPEDYWQERTERYYDKEALREALEDGPIPGVYQEQSYALRVRPSRKELNEK